MPTDVRIGRRPVGPLALLDNRVGSLGCARCGACCETIVLSFDPREPMENGDPENAKLYADYWRVEWADDHHAYDRNGERRPWYGKSFMVTCKAYDAEHRTCTHPNRPPICRDYPHYELAPTSSRHADRVVVHDQDGTVQPFGCSYGLDSPGWSKRGRPLIPVEVIGRNGDTGHRTEVHASV